MLLPPAAPGIDYPPVPLPPTGLGRIFELSFFVTFYDFGLEVGGGLVKNERQEDVGGLELGNEGFVPGWNLGRFVIFFGKS